LLRRRAAMKSSAGCSTRSLIRDSVEAPDLGELARRAGMSPFHFLRRLRDTFGQTPRRLAMEFRITRAKALLAETDLAITEICFECGYESLGSFSHLFRRAVGLSPREFRLRRGRFWPVNVSFLPPSIPFCVLDGFRAGSWE
jgi:AraC-like DNA-binding protein